MFNPFLTFVTEPGALVMVNVYDITMVIDFGDHAGIMLNSTEAVVILRESFMSVSESVSNLFEYAELEGYEEYE